MANFGRRPITKADGPKPHATYFYNGEERLDRRPQGRMVERFVDPVGGVMSIQLAGDGDPQRQITADRVRMEKRRDGWVEHAKCPLRHGTHMTTGVTSKDFAALLKSKPALSTPCATDKKTMERRDGDLHAVNACPHIEALIAYRVTKEAEQAKKRNEKRIQLEQQDAERLALQAAQLEMVKEQIEERKAAKKSRGTKADPA